MGGAGCFPRRRGRRRGGDTPAAVCPALALDYPSGSSWWRRFRSAASPIVAGSRYSGLEGGGSGLWRGVLARAGAAAAGHSWVGEVRLAQGVSLTEGRSRQRPLPRCWRRSAPGGTVRARQGGIAMTENLDEGAPLGELHPWAAQINTTLTELLAEVVAVRERLDRQSALLERLDARLARLEERVTRLEERGGGAVRRGRPEPAGQGGGLPDGGRDPGLGSRGRGGDAGHLGGEAGVAARRAGVQGCVAPLPRLLRPALLPGLAPQAGRARRARPSSSSRAASSCSSQRTWARTRACTAGSAVPRRWRSAVSVPTSWRRRPSRAASSCWAASGSGRGGGCTASAKRASSWASRASLLARWPTALAKSRTWRGVTTATGGPAAPGPPRPAAPARRWPPGPPARGPHPPGWRGPWLRPPDHHPGPGGGLDQGSDRPWPASPPQRRGLRKREDVMAEAAREHTPSASASGGGSVGHR